MNKFLDNIVLKITAVILSFLVFFSLLFSVAGSIIMFFNDFYTQDYNTLEVNIMQDLAKNEMFNLINKYNYSENELESYYNDKNIFYEIENEHTGLILSNYKNENYIVSYSETTFVERFVSKREGVFYCFDQINYDQEKGIYYHYATSEEVYASNQKAKLTIYIPQNMRFTDRFFLMDNLIKIGYKNRYFAIFIALLSLVFSIVIYSYLFISVGRKNSDNKINVAFVNKLPADILTIGTLFLIANVLFVFSKLNALVTTIVVGFVGLSFLYFLLLWYLLSIIVQIKAGMLIKHSFLYWLFKQLLKIIKTFKHIFKNISTAYKTAIVVAIFWAVELCYIGINVFESFAYENIIIGWIFMSAVASIVIILAAIAFQRVKLGGEKILNGDLENKIDTTYMYGDIKDFAESLNNINQGLQSAIDDKMKSERFKTELITNVSHDIKTPLTSIVNYVDLIKKEDCDNPKINEYIEVLDRQSNRLKRLTEDLVEVSKASTGNLSVEFSKCNLNLLISQALGEFSEKLEQKDLSVVQTIEEKELFVMADGKRLWRVFDNLLSNICKYAMQGTRVYIDLKNENGKAVIIFRNISDSPINLSQEELTERFVRGDRSRNTEGSGLGLSIAKSFTELQNGSFEINADGDLFKVKLSFNLIKQV